MRLPVQIQCTKISITHPKPYANYVTDVTRLIDATRLVVVGVIFNVACDI